MGVKKHNKRKNYIDPILIRMFEIYKPNGIDWMLDKETKKNMFTFHHITEERCGGKRIVENGAILTIASHNFLNYLDVKRRELYEELNYLFYCLNITGAPPTEDYFKEVLKIKENALARVRGKKKFY
ncbi:MAG: hypothetical protein GX951_05120 [Mollicutes bacterium]|nr:hypothetical protein [Mollicutes bacterium]